MGLVLISVKTMAMDQIILSPVKIYIKFIDTIKPPHYNNPDPTTKSQGGSMLISIQEMSKVTAIPATTIRRYFTVFEGLPQGVKLGRTTKYPSETVNTVKTINDLYEQGLSTIEIEGRISNTDMVDHVDTTTLPPQVERSLQTDIRDLTDAVKNLTQTIKSFPLCNCETTTKPPNDETTMEQPDHHEASTKTELEPVVEDLPMDELSILEIEVDQDQEQVPDCHGKDLSQAEKDSILIKVLDLYPGRGNAQKRADVLNRAGVPCGKSKAPWDAKKVMDNYRHAKKRQDQ